MDNTYDESLDLGVAVKEESTLSSVKSKKKKRRRKRSGSTSSVDVLPLPTADDNDGDVNNTDRQSSSIKKKKRKKKKKRTGDSIEDTQYGETKDESIQTNTAIAKQAPLKGNFIKERGNLPVYQHREEICNLVSKNDVVLVVAETVSWLSLAFICNECIVQHIILCLSI